MAATMGQSGALSPNLQGPGGAVIMIIMSTQLLRVKPSLNATIETYIKKDDDEDDNVEGYRNDDDDVGDKNDEGSY